MLCPPHPHHSTEPEVEPIFTLLPARLAPSAAALDLKRRWYGHHPPKQVVPDWGAFDRVAREYDPPALLGRGTPGAPPLKSGGVITQWVYPRTRVSMGLPMQRPGTLYLFHPRDLCRPFDEEWNRIMRGPQISAIAHHFLGRWGQRVHAPSGKTPPRPWQTRKPVYGPAFRSPPLPRRSLADMERIGRAWQKC